MVWNIYKLVRFVIRPITSHYVVLTFDDGNICFILFSKMDIIMSISVNCFLMIFFLAKKLSILNVLYLCMFVTSYLRNVDMFVAFFREIYIYTLLNPKYYCLNIIVYSSYF